MPNWGPSHQQASGWLTERRIWRLVSIAVVVALFVLGSVLPKKSSNTVFGALIVFVVLAAVLYVVNRITGLAGRRPRRRARSRTRRGRGDTAADPLVAIRETALGWGGGVYLGATKDGQTRHAREERAVLLLGPPDPVSHCSFRDRHCAKSPASDSITWILRPFRRPAVTWTACRSPRWT